MSESTSEQSNGQAFRVRPYLLTGGRTESSVDLPLETLIHTTETGAQVTENLNQESQWILKMCQQPMSIVELSAHLSVPLQIAKILVSDLLTSGYVATNSRTSDSDERPDLELLQRVLHGLQNL